MGPRRGWRFPEVQRGQGDLLAAPGGFQNTVSRPCATALKDRMDKRMAPGDFFLGHVFWAEKAPT